MPPISSRRTVVALTVLAVFICFLDRIAISVAVIPMAEDFAWDVSVKGAVMSAFFLGYLTLQIPAGAMSDRWGGKVVLGAGVLFWSLATLLTPWSAAAGVTALVVCRFLMGVAEAVTWPAIYSLYSQWIPKHRQSTAIGLMNSGIPGGSMAAMLVTPLIVEAHSWQLAFYIYGALGLCWVLLWWLSVPANNTSQEVGSGEAPDALPDTVPDKKHSVHVPWRLIVTNKPLLGIAAAHVATNWVIFLMLSWLPTYVNDRLGIPFDQVGIVAVVPYIVSIMATAMGGRVSDWYFSKGGDRLVKRKQLQALALIGTAIPLAGLGYTETAGQAIAVISVANVFLGFSVGGFATNHLDIGPEISGTLIGVTNTVAALGAAVSVYFSGLILAATNSWALVYQVAAGAAVLGCLVYLRWASVERQF